MKEREWTAGAVRYTANGAPKIGYWLRCWQGSKLLNMEWFPRYAQIRKAIQEVKRCT